MAGRSCRRTASAQFSRRALMRISSVSTASGMALTPQCRQRTGKGSVPIRGAKREEGPIRTGLVYATRKRGTSEQAGTVGFQRGTVLADWVRPIGIEQRGRGRCVRQCEGIAGGPLAPCQGMIKPGVNRIERGASLRDAIRIARAFGPKRIAHDGL